MHFKTLSSEGLNKYRETCPLEIGRYTVKDHTKTTLHGPLQILKIFSDTDTSDAIMIAPLKHTKVMTYTQLDIQDRFTSQGGASWVASIPILEGNDKMLYTENKGVYYSITRI